MGVRTTLGGTVAATASAIRHVGWWLDWHARARATDACRSFE
jgi:hypothetical protein